MGQKKKECLEGGFEEGRSAVVTGVGVVLTLIVGFMVYRLVPLYYYYFDLQNHMRRAITAAAVETDEEIRRSLMAVIRRHGITCGDRDLRVTREGDTMKLSLHYTEGLGVSLFGREVTLKTIDFDASAQGSFR